MAICGVIFDLGWTLVDFDGDIQASDGQRAADLEAFLGRQGWMVDGAAVFASYRAEMMALRQVAEPYHYECSARQGMLRALSRYIGVTQATKWGADALAASFDCIVPKWQLYPDTLATLTGLREAGYQLGAISNTDDGAHVWDIVDRCGLGAWLAPIYMSEDVGLCKPHPRLFQMLLDEWGLSPVQAVMVGDTLNADVLGAHYAGMLGIWIDRGEVNPWSRNHEFRDSITPDVTIKQLAELPAVLTALNGRLD